MRDHPGVRDGALLLEEVSPASQRRWTLEGDHLTIGRDPAADVPLEDPQVSRRHADLLRHDGEWVIVDDESTNGTYLNNKRVHEANLQPGDLIAIGATKLLLRTLGAPPAPARVEYDVAAQYGTISNVAGNQMIDIHESNLQYIASLRGRARHLITWGLVLFFSGQGVGLLGVLLFQQNVIAWFGSTTAEPPKNLSEFFLAVGIGAFMALLGLAMIIFGLIARSGAKREANRRGVDW